MCLYINTHIYVKKEIIFYYPDSICIPKAHGLLVKKRGKDARRGLWGRLRVQARVAHGTCAPRACVFTCTCVHARVCSRARCVRVHVFLTGPSCISREKL